MPPENSDTVGDFSFWYAPHAYGIAVALDADDLTDVYCQKAAQVIWTTLLSAYILYLIDQAPAPILAMFSAEGAAREYSLEKLKPYVEHCDAAQEKIDVSGSRREGNSILYKKFPGGFLKLLGSNAVRSAKSTPAPVLIVEEPDDANENVQGQGDSVTVFFNRSKRFRKSRVKRILGGTPTIKDFSRTADRLKKTDQCVLPIECNSCGESHVLDFANVSWLDLPADVESHEIFGRADTDTAIYACPHCGDAWSDTQRQQNIRDTVARAMERGERYCGWQPTKPDVKELKGFVDLSELYSCLPGSGLREMVETYLEAEYYAARGDQTKKISFVNNQLGKEYEIEDDRPDADVLREAAKIDPDSQHEEFICPAYAALVTIGIDVQHDRLAITIRGFGPGMKSGLMYWGEISGNPKDFRDPIWDALDQIVFQAFQHASGAKIYASAISIDSSDGQTSDAVYDWVRTRQKRHPSRLIMAVKGSSDRQDPEIYSQPKSKSVDHKRVDKQSKADKRGVKVFIVGTNKSKDFVAKQMGLNPPLFHYYNVEQMRVDYFEQMLSEAKIPHKTYRNRLVWQRKAGRPAEAWDCERYAIHAAYAKRWHLMNAAQWAMLKKALVQEDLFSPEPEEQQQSASKPFKPSRPKRKKGFVNSWKQ